MANEVQTRVGTLDISGIEQRVGILCAELRHLKDIMISKMDYEARLFGVREQKKFADNAGADKQAILEAGEQELIKSIANADALCLKLREKLMRGLGK